MSQKTKRQHNYIFTLTCNDFIEKKNIWNTGREDPLEINRGTGIVIKALRAHMTQGYL